MGYTNTFACPQCCTTTCETLSVLFGQSGWCPGAVPNVDATICLNVRVVHTAAKPATPFGGTFLSDCRTTGANFASVISGTSGTNPDLPGTDLIDRGTILFQDPTFLYCDIRVPTSQPGAYYSFGVHPGTGLPDVVRPDMATLNCSPFSISTLEQTCWYFPNTPPYYPTIDAGKFHLEISLGTCPIVPPAGPTPLVAQVTTPCKHLGPQIQDPAKCQCGTANLMACALYGTCRRTGTPLAGEPICLTCPSYQA